MKRMMYSVSAIIVFAGLVVPNAFGDTRGNCNYANLQGSFGFTLTGSRTDSNPGARAAVGELIADGNGNLSGSETQSNNGTIVKNVTETGTYTVSSNCTGSATLTFSAGADSATRTFTFVILHYSGEFLAIVTDTGRIETIDFKTQ